MSVAMRTVVLTVPSAHCATCRLRILEALTLEGITQAEVDLRTREATILFDPGRTSAAAVVAALSAAGHPPAVEPTPARTGRDRCGALSAHDDARSSHGP